MSAELLEDDLDPVDDPDLERDEYPAVYRPRPPRRSVANQQIRAALLELVGSALEAKVASELEDDDRALRALEQTLDRAGVLADELRARLSHPAPTVPLSPTPDRGQQP